MVWKKKHKPFPLDVGRACPVPTYPFTDETPLRLHESTLRGIVVGGRDDDRYFEVQTEVP